MSEHYPKENSPDDEHAAGILAKRLQSMLERYVREMPPHSSPEIRKQILVTRLAEVGEDLFSDAAEEYADFTKSLLETPLADGADLTNEVAKRFATFALRFNSAEEFENKLRIHTAERSGWVPVNEALSYELKEGTYLNLHIPATFTKRPIEWSTLFNQGLQELARRLTTDPSLANVQALGGHSWLIFEQPKLVSRFGFTVSDQNPATHKALATISREDFIKRYAQ
jgi:hypothetical protein